MIASKVVTTGESPLFTATKSTAVTLIVLCNTGNTADEITIHAVPSGGSAADENIILKNHSMSPSRTFLFNIEKFILNAGDSIAAVSKNGTISATVSGMALE